MHVNFGIIAEPEGYVTNGGNMAASSLPPDAMLLYRSVGGTINDPLVRYVSSSRREKMLDGKDVLKDLLVHTPRALVDVAEHVFNKHLRYTLCVPERDAVTGAPYALVFAIDPQLEPSLPKLHADLICRLRELTRLFWQYVQTSGLLVGFSGLTARQREVLVYASRGFSLVETAEHMNVSLRSAEKTLSNARRALGAPTTASAVYRSMVYRALV